MAKTKISKIMSKDMVMDKISTEQESLEKLLNTVLRPILEQTIRIYQDVLDNYTNEKEAEEYCRKQISLFKSSAGLLCPVDQARFCIDLYHEILNEEKEYRK